MKSAANLHVLKTFSAHACKISYFVGNALTVFGCTALLLGILNIFDMELFAFGLSSGVRIIGTIAIAGCLLSAIGYGVSDFIESK